MAKICGLLRIYELYKILPILLIEIFFYSRACEALCQCLPDQLKDDTFSECLKDDKSTKHWLSMLLKNLENMTPGQQGGANQNMNNAIGTYVYSLINRRQFHISCHVLA